MRQQQDTFHNIEPAFDASELISALELLDEIEADMQQQLVETFPSTIH